jgi:hypothetical protein
MTADKTAEPGRPTTLMEAHVALVRIRPRLALIIHGVCRVACRSSHVDLLLVC